MNDNNKRIIELKQNMQVFNVTPLNSLPEFSQSNRIFTKFCQFLIFKHQNDIFDWILNNKFSSDELNDDLIFQMSGNIHSFIEIIKKLILPNDFVNSLFSDTLFI